MDLTRYDLAVELLQALREYTFAKCIRLDDGNYCMIVSGDVRLGAIATIEDATAIMERWAEEVGR